MVTHCPEMAKWWVKIIAAQIAKGFLDEEQWTRVNEEMLRGAPLTDAEKAVSILSPQGDRARYAVLEYAVQTGRAVKDPAGGYLLLSRDRPAGPPREFPPELLPGAPNRRKPSHPRHRGR
jgi:hypothetical protein